MPPAPEFWREHAVPLARRIIKKQARMGIGHATCFTLVLAIQLFRSWLEHGWHIPALCRQIPELWDMAHNLSNLTGIGTGVEGVKQRLPSPQVLMRLMVAMQTWFPRYLDSVDMDKEGKLLRLDATYASAKTCRRWISLAMA